MIKNKNLRIVGLLILVAALSLSAITYAQDGTARAWLGVSIRDGEAGVTVENVMPDSPASTAGIEQGDVIVSLEGSDVETSQGLIDMLGAYSPQDTVELGLRRGEEDVNLSVELGIFPEELETERGFSGRGGRDGFEFNFGDANARSVLPLLGVMVDETDAGLEVTRVLPSAEDSDLQVGDIITAINGEPVAELDQRALLETIFNSAGEAIEVTITRDGEEMTIELQPLENVPFTEVIPAVNRVRLGVQYQEITPEFAANLGIDTSAGALLTNVLPESAAESAGLMAGDIVTAVAGTAVDADHTLAALISGFEDGDTVTLTIIRAGEEMEIDVTLESSDVPFQFFDRNGRFFGDVENLPDFDFGRLRDFDNLGQGLEEFFGNLGAELEGEIPENFDSLSVICTDADGNEVFSLELRGNRRFTPSFQLPNGRGGLDFTDLSCSVSADEVPAAPPANEGSDT